MNSSATLQICEIFTSIQGESTRAGIPCTFIRLAGCNLRCAYCDTRISHGSGESAHISWILQQVRDAGVNLVEITGGEPLMQKGTGELAEALLAEGYVVLIETNGSMPLDRVTSRAVRIMDVKGPGSGHADSVLESNFNELQPSDEVKFVLTSREDYLWAREVIEKHDLLARCPVLLSPVMPGLNPADLAQWLLQDRLNARLQVQLHKLLGVQ